MKERKDARGPRRPGRAIRERLTYANVMSTIAVFGVLAGGGAYAASQIGPKDIAENAVLSKHIKARNVKTADIADNAVTAPKLACKGNSSEDKMVKVGSVCIDKYEASIWTERTGGQQINGTIPCDANGQDCKGKIYARSVKGVKPRANITWFQAAQALANSGKRLPTNAEWQMAVVGTPDSTACNVTTDSAAETGANAGCVSNYGAFDMVGNVWERVGDWAPRSTACGSWDFSDDLQCLAGAQTSGAPGALLRGGGFFDGPDAGPFAVIGLYGPSISGTIFGFRGAR